MKTGFSLWESQGVPCEPYRVWVCSVVLRTEAVEDRDVIFDQGHK